MIRILVSWEEYDPGVILHMIRKFLVKKYSFYRFTFSEASETHMDPGCTSHLLAGWAVGWPEVKETGSHNYNKMRITMLFPMM